MFDGLRFGDFIPAIIGLLVAAIGSTMILLEKRRRRLRAAAGLPIYGPAVRPEGAEGTGAVRQSLTLSREVVEHFRSTGPGWQARIDEVLRRHVAEAKAGERRVAEPRKAWRGEDE